MAGNFLEQIKRAQRAKEPEPAEAKTPEQMSDAELEDAITAARRRLLDAQHAELRERELARVAGAPAEQQGSGTTLAGILREKQAGKRRTWR